MADDEYGPGFPEEWKGIINDCLDRSLGKEEPNLNNCPQCGGPADNGNDRCVPPSAYLCSKCEDKFDGMSDVEYFRFTVVEACEKACICEHDHESCSGFDSYNPCPACQVLKEVCE